MPSDSRLPIPDSPRFAVLTPAGRGAIATVAIRGVGALAAIARRFQPATGHDLTAFQAGRTVFGRFQTSATTSEELVVGLVAPGEFEIHCHGGKAAIEAICDSLIAEGCQRITPDWWAMQSEQDPLATEALLALADARTERTAAILLDQYRGALRKELSLIEQSLAQNNASAAHSAIETLLHRAKVGLHLTQPWRVVLAGRPNAGKSSLMNAILGYQRSIVWHEPGTTRDVLTATTAIDGWPIELIDTAGLRQEGKAPREDEAPAEPIEAEGIARAHDQIATADLVLVVIDATAPRWVGLWPASHSSLIVHNKIDLAPTPHDGHPPGFETSALTGQGIENLCQAITQIIVPAPPNAGAAVPFTSPHVASLRAVAEALKSGHIGAAQAYLHSFPGYNLPNGHECRQPVTFQ